MLGKLVDDHQVQDSLEEDKEPFDILDGEFPFTPRR